MVSVNIRIEKISDKETYNPEIKVFVDLLKREDADEIEWEIAKAVEMALQIVLNKIDNKTSELYQI